MKILMIGSVWPEITSSAAGLRAWNLIRTCLTQKWDVSYAAASPKSSFSEQLEKAGVPTFPVQPNDPSFDTWLGELSPDLVIFDRFMIEEQYGWRVLEHCPTAARIVDTIDLHFIRRAREQILRQQESQNQICLEDIYSCNFELMTDTALREVASIYRSDASLIISDYEMTLLQKKLNIPAHLLHLARFLYPEPEPLLSFDDRKDFVFIGNFRHAPNADGVRWLKKEIWPAIHQKLPTSKLFVYGAYPSKEMMNLTDKKNGFLVEGSAPDQFQILKKARVNLVPLRYGAGIKGKISDGWWVGTPNVTTPIGAEGMHGELPWGGLIGRNAQDFVEAAVLLYQDSLTWENAQKQGLEILKTLYNERTQAQELANILSGIKNNLASIRKSNWVGALLNHHQFQSTKYFSKWIEAKNKVSSN